ncbi:MAG: helix-turn-helix domain-containing protein [Oscillospiraceae bacterium]|nr:helix-turn-helix domain-containing protein [Oscillospiraceae bacterium]
MSEINMQFGRRLKQARQERQMTLEAMGRLLGTSKQVLSRYENGLRSPKVNVVRLYAERLGVDVRYLIGETDRRRETTPERAPERKEVSVISRNGDKKVYNVDADVANWVCDLLDDPAKLGALLTEDPAPETRA